MTPDNATLLALDHLLAAGWEITMSRHPDRSQGAPEPGAIVKVVRLRQGGAGGGLHVVGRSPRLLEALRLATREAERALGEA